MGHAVVFCDSRPDVRSSSDLGTYNDDQHINHRIDPTHQTGNDPARWFALKVGLGV